MAERSGLRERKKAQTRERLADVAAALFAERGYDQVSIADVARAGDVSDQTVYNYFPAKHDLVLDRADEIRRRYGRVIRERPDHLSPARAVEPLITGDLARFAKADPLAAGEFPALTAASPVLRRYALEFRERQAETVAEAILSTHPAMPALVARSHAAALVSVVGWVTDQIGAAVLARAPVGPAAAETARAANVALDALDRQFHAIAGSTGPSTV